MKTSIFKIMTIIGASLAAGIISGLFGTGGGILIVFLFSKIYAKSAKYDQKDCFAMTVASVILISSVSLFSYLKSGDVTSKDILPSLLPAVLGGAAGAFVLDKINTAWLRKLFAAIVTYAGITMLFR